MNRNRKDWADKVGDALRAYKTTFMTPLGMSPYGVVYGKPYYPHIDIEHIAWWAIKMLDYNLTKTTEERRLQLGELKEIRVEAY